MEQDTFAQRLRTVMERKNLNTVEVAKLAGVSRQSVNYILNNNLKSSKLSLQFALALNVSYDWLARGIDDNSFLELNEILVFTDIFDLIQYIHTKKTDNIRKSVSYNKLLQKDAFVFLNKANNTYYYCSTDKSIESSQYINIDLEHNTFNIVNKSTTKTCFPIVEIKQVLL